MSTSAAFAAISAANSASAAASEAAAREAAQLACQASMPAYAHQSSGIEQMRAYADCVNLLYPGEDSSLNVMLVKAMIAACFVSIAIAVYILRKDEYIDTSEWFMMILLAGIAGPVGVLTLFWAWNGVIYLFTA